MTIYEYTLTDLEQKLCSQGAEMRYNIARSSGVKNGKIGHCFAYSERCREESA